MHGQTTIIGKVLTGAKNYCQTIIFSFLLSLLKQLGHCKYDSKNYAICKILLVFSFLVCLFVCLFVWVFFLFGGGEGARYNANAYVFFTYASQNLVEA